MAYVPRATCHGTPWHGFRNDFSCLLPEESSDSMRLQLPDIENYSVPSSKLVAASAERKDRRTSTRPLTYTRKMLVQQEDAVKWNLHGCVLVEGEDGVLDTHVSSHCKKEAAERTRDKARDPKLRNADLQVLK